MLKKYLIILILLAEAVSCRDTEKTNNRNQKTETDNTQRVIQVFPVTDYLLGQIDHIERMEITPLKVMTKDGRPDSVWIRREDIGREALPFLQPVIDSTSLQQYYQGNSFLDRTVGYYTFTYTPKNKLPDSIDLTKIDVYVDTTTNKVQRIYLVKEHRDSIIQLTWRTGKWFSIRTFVGNHINEKKIKWDFTE